MKDELFRNIMKKNRWLKSKNSSYLMDKNSEDKKVKDTKKCVIKRKPIFGNYKKLFRSNST